MKKYILLTIVLFSATTSFAHATSREDFNSDAEFIRANKASFKVQEFAQFEQLMEKLAQTRQLDNLQGGTRSAQLNEFETQTTAPMMQLLQLNIAKEDLEGQAVSMAKTPAGEFQILVSLNQRLDVVCEKFKSSPERQQEFNKRFSEEDSSEIAKLGMGLVTAMMGQLPNMVKGAESGASVSFQRPDLKPLTTKLCLLVGKGFGLELQTEVPSVPQLVKLVGKIEEKAADLK